MAELNLIFSTTIYSAGKRPLGGGGEAAFWFPLIGLFAGARLEEIGQLLTADIRRQGEIDYFDFTDIDEEAERQGKPVANKNLKTLASRRKVPIHPVLIELGFLDYVAKCRREGGRFLFPQLREYLGRRTKNWSKCGRGIRIRSSRRVIASCFTRSVTTSLSGCVRSPALMKPVKFWVATRRICTGALFRLKSVLISSHKKTIPRLIFPWFGIIYWLVAKWEEPLYYINMMAIQLTQLCERGRLRKEK